MNTSSLHVVNGITLFTTSSNTTSHVTPPPENEFTNTTNCTPLHEAEPVQWEQLNTAEKIQEVLVDVLIHQRNVTTEEITHTAYSLDRETAQAELNTTQHYFFHDLDQDISDQWLMTWPFLINQQARDKTKLNLIRLALRAYIDHDPQVHYHTLFNYSLSLYENDAPLKQRSVLETLRLYQLKEYLSEIPLKQVEHLKDHPLQLFKAVLSYYQQAFPPPTFWEQLPQITLSEAYLKSLDEAALLWKQLQTGQMLNDIAHLEDGTMAVTQLRHTYLDALIPAYQKQKTIDQLFRTADHSNTTIFFDGFAFKNAQNLSFNELSNRPEWIAIPEYQRLSPEQQRTYLQNWFEQIGESTQYPIGSLFHSLASCLIRLFHYQHHTLPPLFSDKQQLIHLFKQTEEEWAEKKNYPIHPRILAAMHLASSNNLPIAGNDWQQKTTFLLRYFAQAFQAILQPEQVEQLKPCFHPQQAVRDILHEYGFSGLPPDQTVEAFLKRAKTRQLMTIKQVTLDPHTTLEKKKAAFDNRLVNDPWIAEQAKNRLKQQEIEITPLSLKQASEQVAKQYQAATTNDDQWAQSIHSWVYWVPVIGPLATIKEGIQNGDWKTFLLGAVFLSLDAWSFGLSDLARSVPLYLSRLSAKELMTANSLRTTLKTMRLPSTELAQEHLVINPTPFMPEDQYESLIESVRHGATNQPWRDPQGKEHLLIYITNENRVVPVQHQGGYYREVSWETGKIDFTKPLIYKDKETGQYTLSALKGGSLDDFIEPIPEAELAERPTVKEALQALSDANDYRTDPDFLKKFHQHFTIVGSSKAVRFKIESTFFKAIKHDDQSIDTAKLYHHIYCHSPTFRRLSNKFFASNQPSSPWRIVWETGQKCRADLQNKVIYLNPHIEQSEARYFGTDYIHHPDYEGTAFRSIEVFIHEMNHALTGMGDLELNKLIPWKRRHSLSDQAHRGGIVYLTDKVSSETFEPHFPRLVYRAFTQGKDILGAEILISRVMQENRFLNKLDAQVPIEEYKMIAGVEWNKRYTIQETIKIMTPFNRPPSHSTNMEGFLYYFSRLFTSKDKSLFNDLCSFYSFLHDESKTFQNLADHYISRLSKPIRPIELIEVKRDTLATMTLPQAEIIHFADPSGIRYLSDRGLVPLEKERLFLEKLIEHWIGAEEVPLAHQLTDQGPVVQITGQIFREVRMNYLPERLAAALVLPGDIETAKQLLENGPTLGYAALLENKILKKMIYKKEVCLFPCTSTDMARVKKADPIIKTMQQIKQANQTAGIEMRPEPTTPSVRRWRFPGFFKNATLGTLTGLAISDQLNITARR